eukprot:gene41138-54501_t
MEKIAGLRSNGYRNPANRDEVLMGPKPADERVDHDLFRAELVNLIDQRHELVKLEDLTCRAGCAGASALARKAANGCWHRRFRRRGRRGVRAEEIVWIRRRPGHSHSINSFRQSLTCPATSDRHHPIWSRRSPAYGDFSAVSVSGRPASRDLSLAHSAQPLNAAARVHDFRVTSGRQGAKPANQPYKATVPE